MHVLPPLKHCHYFICAVVILPAQSEEMESVKKELIQEKEAKDMLQKRTAKQTLAYGT